MEIIYASKSLFASLELLPTMTEKLTLYCNMEAFISLMTKNIFPHIKQHQLLNERS
jgi:hypothetical protein